MTTLLEKFHHKVRSNLIHQSKFRFKALLVFAVIFGSIGAYVLHHSSATTLDSANVWVDTDGGSCTRSTTLTAYDTTKACASFDSAYAVAQAGDQVIIKGGTYPNNQVINWRADHHDYASRVVFRVASGETVKVTGTGTSGEIGNGRGLYIMAEHLEIHGSGAGIASGGGDGNLVFADTSNNYTSVNLTYVNSSGSSNDCQGAGLDQHANDIVIDGIRARSILTSCASNATIENSTFGCTGDPQLGINTCSQNIFGDGPRAGSNTNLKIIGNVFRDVLIGTDGQHTGCIFVEGATDSLISGNWLQSCAVNDIQYKPTGVGVFAGTQIIENNWETRQCGSGSPCGSGSDDNSVLNNLYSAKYIIRFNTSEGTCNFIDTGSTYVSGTQVYGNLCTAYSGTSMPCGLANVTYGYNIWPTSGNKCDPTDVLADVPVVHAANFDGPLNDFHLVTTSTTAQNLVPTDFLSGCPATDIDGDTRPQGTICDAGADEYVPSANVWIATTGSDSTCVRGDPTKPCLTFNKAFQIAQSGDIIEVGAGTYIGPEYVYPNPAIASKVIFRPAAGANINIQDASGHGQPVFIKASHVEFDNFPFGYQDFAGAGACGWSCPSHTYGLQIAPPNGANGSYVCISDIVIKNATGHSFSVNNGISDVSFIGGTWGNLGWRLGETSDHATSWNAPAIGGSVSYKCPDSSTTATAVTNITFDGVHFGNNFQGCENATVYGANPQSTCVEPTHPDCLHVFGETVGLHIKNSWFDHCMGFYLNLNVENAYVVDGQARIKDALFENNVFGDDNAGGYDSWNQIAPAGTGPLYTVCDNVIFRNNTFGHDQSPNPLFAINCSLAAGASTGVQFYNNIFTNWGSSACPATAIFDHNLFIAGPSCGTNSYTGSAGFNRAVDAADSSYGWASDPWTSDFHIDTSSAAINQGLSAQCPAVDFDSQARSLSDGACDAGADEYLSGYTPPPTGGTGTTGGGSTTPPKTKLKGDCNADGHVSVIDLSILLSHYGTNYAAADFDSNHTVNVIDLSMLLSNYGR